jgi:CO/xanthine dehydrogenase Mo-binding subunit
MVMTREEVFRASGPTSGSTMRVKIGAKKDGRIVAADAMFALQAGAFPGSPSARRRCAASPATTSITSRSSASTW